jgi:PilZ domain
LNRRKPETERRKWPRLPLAIPIFIRNSDENGKEFLEFATALNVSAGGVLVAVRRSLPLSSPVSLEIPSAPLGSGASLPKVARNFQARAIWGEHADGYQLVGLKFAQSLLDSSDGDRPPRRKVLSAV